MIKTRCHKLSRVYVFDSKATDLLITGTVDQGLVNGKSVAGEWVARICLKQAGGDNLKIESHQVWAVCCIPFLSPRQRDKLTDMELAPQNFGGIQKEIQEALAS